MGMPKIDSFSPITSILSIDGAETRSLKLTMLIALTTASRATGIHQLNIKKVWVDYTIKLFFNMTSYAKAREKDIRL